MNLRVAGALAVALLLTAPAYGQTADGAAGGNAPQSSSAPPAPIAPAAPAAASAAPAPAAPTTAPAPATTATAPPPTTSAPPTTTAPKSGFVGIDLPPPPPGKGEVVFFRPKDLQGWAIWFNIRENGKALGKLTNGVYFVAFVDPGAHTFTAATENKDTLKLIVEPGQTYYVAGSITMGFWVGEANIAPSDQEDFLKASHNLKLANPPADDSSGSHDGATN